MRRRRSKGRLEVAIAAAVVAQLTLAYPGAAQGAQQDTVRVPYRVACARCVILTESLATFGHPSDPVLRSIFSTVGAALSDPSV